MMDRFRMKISEEIDKFLSMVCKRENKKKGYNGAIFELKLNVLLEEFYKYIKEK